MKMIAAACDGMGIGKNGDLPWRLKGSNKISGVKYSIIFGGVIFLQLYVTHI